MLIEVAPGISFDDALLEERFIRAPGPGGQNVNKVETAVQLRFNVAKAYTLPPYLRARLIELAGSRASLAGVISIEAHRFRSRERNREDALERLFALIRQAAHRPEPRIATRPTRGSRERKLKEKSSRGKIKRLRGRVDDGD